MCRDQHRNKTFLSDAASWINVFRIGRSIHRSCPEEGLKGKWISRLCSVKTRRSKESTNVDLCYLFSAQNLLHMGSCLWHALDISPCLWTEDHAEQQKMPGSAVREISKKLFQCGTQALFLMEVPGWCTMYFTEGDQVFLSQEVNDQLKL